MPVTIDWGQKIINVPQDYLTPVVSPTLYELNIDTFRKDLKALEASEEGMPELDTHSHNTEVTVAGTTIARVVEIINGYTITFEDGQYAVNLVGANSNIAEVQNVNQVSTRSFNTAGLITVTSGSGLSQAQNDELFAIRTVVPNNVWEEAIASHQNAGSTGEALEEASTAATLPDGAGIADAVWDETLTPHVTSTDSAADALAAAAEGASPPPTPAEIADAVWDEVLGPHVTSTGSTGDALDTAATAASATPTAGEVADAVWDEDKADHTGSGSFGEAVGDVHATSPPPGAKLTRAPDQLTPVVKDTAVVAMMYLVLQSDHVTPAAGVAAPTIVISKNGDPWQGISPTVTDVGAGWWKVELTADHTDTAGVLVVRASSGDCDESSQSFFVEARPDYRAGTIQAGTLSTTQATTDLQETAVDHWKDSFIRFTSGTLRGQVRFVTGYTPPSGGPVGGTLTFEALTSAPSAGDLFVLVNA